MSSAASAATTIVITPSEPGYESLPSLRSNNDPGYETVQLSPTAGVSKQRKPNSDYDPNYEVLRPSVLDDGHEDDMLYAKVWQHSAAAALPSSTDDLNDGYSSIKLPTTTVTTNIASSSNHYARISETPKTSSCAADDTASDLYASITTIISPPNYLNVQQQDVTTAVDTSDDHNYSTISETTTQSTAVPATLSSSMYSNMSTDEPRTTPSSESNSSDTQIGYQSIRSGNDETITTTASRSSRLMELSNYESLTGSESDPNYESVRYVDVDVGGGGGSHENPYERLYNESGPTSPPIVEMEISAGVPSLVTTIPNVPTSPRRNDGVRLPVEVDDYFQV